MKCLNHLGLITWWVSTKGGKLAVALGTNAQHLLFELRDFVLRFQVIKEHTPGGETALARREMFVTKNLLFGKTEAKQLRQSTGIAPFGGCTKKCRHTS